MIDISHITSKYNVNKQGYRTYNFEKINWENSYLLLGCSQAFGEGLENDSDTISSNLENLLNKKVINLGAPASGIDFQYYNLLTIFQQGHTPKGIFIIWPHPHRYCRLINEKVKFFGPWSENDYEKSFIETAPVVSHFNTIAINSLCNLKSIPLVSINRWPGFVEAGPHYSEQPIDCTPDGSGHYGPKSTKRIAEELYKRYNEI
jgi:hypothetical protein